MDDDGEARGFNVSVCRGKRGRRAGEGELTVGDDSLLLGTAHVTPPSDLFRSTFHRTLNVKYGSSSE